MAMSLGDPYLDALADRAVFSLSALARAPLPDLQDPLSVLLELGERLPTGLVHCERILLVPDPPHGLERLSPRSRWFAQGRTLIAHLDRAGQMVERTLFDLGRYHRAARAIGERLRGRDALLEAIASDAPEPLARAVLVEGLGTSPLRIERTVNLGLVGDLREMAGRRFDPEVRIHSDLCPRKQAERGTRLARALLGRLPPGQFHLLISDSTAAIELLSPFVRDVGHALYAWSRENPDAIHLPGLADRLEQTPDEPEADLAGLVVSDLFMRAPELLDERREQEATQGLHLEDSSGVAHGFAELTRLADPDPVVFREAREGTVALLAGGSPRTIAAAAQVLIESARVLGFALVFEAKMPADAAILPSALVGSHDAVRLPSVDHLNSLASRYELHVTRSGPVPAEVSRGASPLALGLIGLVRRAVALGSLPAALPVSVVLHSANPRSVKSACVRFSAARLALLSLLEPSTSAGGLDAKIPKPETKSRFARRFRA